MAHPQNSYERGVPREEGERLAALDVINTTANNWTTDIIGRLQSGQIVFDLGAGESTALRDFVRQHEGVVYIAQDIRPEAVAAHAVGGDNLTTVIEGDARHGLVLPPDSLDVAHVRYFLAFFDEDTRRNIISGLYEATTTGGRVVATEYDWSAVTGSDDVKRLRDLGLSIKLFKANYGAVAGEEIASVVGPEAVVETHRLRFPPLTDYAPLLNLRGVITGGLRGEEDGERLSAEASAMFDRLEAESRQPDRPAFIWPDAVTTVVTKPETP